MVLLGRLLCRGMQQLRILGDQGLDLFDIPIANGFEKCFHRNQWLCKLNAYRQLCQFKMFDPAEVVTKGKIFFYKGLTPLGSTLEGSNVYRIHAPPSQSTRLRRVEQYTKLI